MYFSILYIKKIRIHKHFGFKIASNQLPLFQYELIHKKDDFAYLAMNLLLNLLFKDGASESSSEEVNIISLIFNDLFYDISKLSWRETFLFNNFAIEYFKIN